MAIAAIETSELVGMTIGLEGMPFGLEGVAVAPAFIAAVEIGEPRSATTALGPGGLETAAEAAALESAAAAAVLGLGGLAAIAAAVAAATTATGLGPDWRG